MWFRNLLAKFTAQFVGADHYGNRYFQKNSFLQTSNSSRRWVVYNGPAEASKIPAEWHGWLHHTHVAPIVAPKHAWQQPHEMNLSGTPQAYRPAASLYKSFKSTVDQRYQAWHPEINQD